LRPKPQLSEPTATSQEPALACTQRAVARYSLGRPGWQDDLRHGLAMARSTDPLSYAVVVAWVYVPGIPSGVLRPDDSAMREILRIAERSADDLALSNAQMALGFALVHRPTDAERDRGQTLLTELSELFVRRGYLLGELLIINVYLARERARRGDRDEAIALMHAAVDHLLRELRPGWALLAICVLVETLIDRGTHGDMAEAEAAIERLAAAATHDGSPLLNIWLLRLRALLARAHDDAKAYAHLRDRYWDMAKLLGFEGHIAWAEAMP
jgi:hypothetical protein